MMRRYSDPRIGDLAHGILSLPRFNPLTLLVLHINPFKVNEIACGEDTDTSLPMSVIFENRASVTKKFRISSYYAQAISMVKYFQK